MHAQQVAFGAIALLLWGLFHAWIGSRLLGTPRLPRLARILGWVLVALLGLAPFVSMMLSRVAGESSTPEEIHWIGFTAMGLSSILVCFLIVVDLPRQLLRAALALRRRLRAGVGQRGDGSPALPERRHFLTDVASLGMLGGAGALTGVGYLRALRLPELVEVEIPVPDLPDALVGTTIAQITDLHIGPTIHGAWLRRVVERVNELDADLVVVTGDLVDGFVADLAPHVAPLADLRARLGTYFVTGNHEYYWDSDAWCEHVASLGLTVLDNDHRVLTIGDCTLLVAGVSDHSTVMRDRGRASDPRGTMNAAPRCDLSLLLAHQPRSIFEAAAAGFDLQLSGHTHGGQYFPMSLLVGLVQPYVSGLHLHEDTWLYVSRGTGYWGPPNRIGSPAEITRVRLVRA